MASLRMMINDVTLAVQFGVNRIWRSLFDNRVTKKNIVKSKLFRFYPDSIDI